MGGCSGRLHALQSSALVSTSEASCFFIPISIGLLRSAPCVVFFVLGRGSIWPLKLDFVLDSFVIYILMSTRFSLVMYTRMRTGRRSWAKSCLPFPYLFLLKKVLATGTRSMTREFGPASQRPGMMACVPVPARPIPRAVLGRLVGIVRPAASSCTSAPGAPLPHACRSDAATVRRRPTRRAAVGSYRRSTPIPCSPV